MYLYRFGCFVVFCRCFCCVVLLAVCFIFCLLFSMFVYRFLGVVFFAGLLLCKCRRKCNQLQFYIKHTQILIAQLHSHTYTRRRPRRRLRLQRRLRCQRRCPLIKRAIFSFVSVFICFSSAFFRTVLLLLLLTRRTLCYQHSALPTPTELPSGFCFFFLLPVLRYVWIFSIFLLPRCVVFPVISTC